MMRWYTTLVLVLSFAVAGVALASEQSDLLTKHGLVPFHEGRYQQALTLFTQAVEADREDPYAHYYKGVTEGRLEHWDAAVADLQEAMRIKPDLTQGALELGVALVKTGQYETAKRWLTQAQQAPDLATTASFYLGLAQLQLGELAKARESLQRAAAGTAADPQLAATVRYYQGVVEARAGNQEEAKAKFEQVVAASPDSDIGRQAHAFLVGLQEGGAPTLRRYHLYAGTGLEYDSNIILAPSDEKAAAGFGSQSDGRAILLAGGSYNFWRAEHVQLSGGYDFFQSLHFHLNQFNIQDHRASLSLSGNSGIFEGGVLGGYDYYLRQTDSFLQQAEAFPWLRISEPGLGRTEVFFRFRWRDFKERAVAQVLDSNTYMTGFDQFFHFASPDRYCVLGYRFNAVDTINGAVNVFAYNGNQVRAGLGWALPWEIPASLDFTYRFKNYAPASGGRDDNEYRLMLSAQKQVAPYTFLTFAYFGTFNESNKAAFQYDRQIVSLAVQVRY
jgi:tetratricopeptide (TPR) repeat protein